MSQGVTYVMSHRRDARLLERSHSQTVRDARPTQTNAREIRIEEELPLKGRNRRALQG